MDATPTANKSKTNKTLIAIGAVALLCVCACAAAFLAFRSFGDTIVDDPAKIAAVADKIAKYKVPPGYSERMGMDLGVYQFIVLGSNSDPSSMIMLANYNAVAADSQQMQEQLQRSFEQQTGTPGMTWTTVENRKTTIRGQEVNLVIREGQVEGQAVTLRQLVAAFEGEHGTVMVLAQGDSDSWNDKLINDFLASIE